MNSDSKMDNKNLMLEAARLTQTLSDCQTKIQRLVHDIENIEEERARENRLLSDSFIPAKKSAGDNKAQLKAEEIIASANMTAIRIKRKSEAHAEAVREKLELLLDIIKSSREKSKMYFEDLETELRGAAGYVGTVPDSYAPERNDSEAAESGGEDIYDEFLKKMGLTFNHTKPADNRPGKIIGRFGDF